MYEVGQKVVYGIHGVCDILDIEVKTIDRQKIAYFVLEPLEQPGTRYYIPKDKPAALSKLSPLISRQELENLIASCDPNGSSWIADENQRKLRYRELISSGDRRALVVMVHTLHVHKKKQAEQGRKFHLCDDNFLRDAEKLLCSEFSLVLNMTREETAAYLKNHFEQ